MCRLYQGSRAPCCLPRNAQGRLHRRPQFGGHRENILEKKASVEIKRLSGDVRTVKGAWKAMLASDAGRQCGEVGKDGQKMLGIHKRSHDVRDQLNAVDTASGLETTPSLSWSAREGIIFHHVQGV